MKQENMRGSESDCVGYKKTRLKNAQNDAFFRVAAEFPQ